MLDAIGAGATATGKQDWHQIWNTSREGAKLQSELETIHTEGRSRPVVETISHSEFATSWFYQAVLLSKRGLIDHWRNTNYLVAKLSFNIFGGLFIGFSFFQSPNSQEGLQNKLFVRTLFKFPTDLYSSMISFIRLSS